ncbi:unnamed protein product [Pieris macdunnoughi]|uniref:PiggyBac transposable element-derived protein 4 n=1 Tax=Pieris macdunnoughi TaxID=345717 RepID=A0A821UKK7_9NEOP|nr:unnamed protein product [Pieris macdunnoughi]
MNLEQEIAERCYDNTEDPQFINKVSIYQQFRTMLGRNLVDNYTSRKRTINSLPTFVTKRPTPDSRQKTVYGVPETLRLADVGTHLPGELPKYRRCRYCSSKGNSKKSKIECVRCRVALCAVPCFADFHQT